LSALAATVTGELLVAGRDGELVLMSALSDNTQTRITSTDASRDASKAAACAFLESTDEVPADDEDLETHLLLTDGTRTWEAGDLAGVTAASATDPTWLQLQAAVNTARLRSE